MPEPIGSHGMRYQVQMRYEGGMEGLEPLFVTHAMVERAAEVIAEYRGHVTGAYDSDREMAREALRAALAFREEDAK